MAIFELDGGRGTEVQPMRPRADSFEVDSATLVSSHVGALLGEHVLPVREGAASGPHLLALDAAARPVVVEVVQLLDEVSLVRALRHAGGAARLSRADLARMYRGGADAFEADLAVFRDRAPILQTGGGDGVRLVVVCADVTDGLLDAVDFVTAGLHVEVLRLGVTHGPGGRRYVDVSPLRSGTAGPRRAVEPGPRTGSIQVAPRASGAAVTDPTPAVPAAAAPVTPDVPATPAAPAAAAGSDDLATPSSPAAAPAPSAAPPVTHPAPGVPQPAADEAGPHRHTAAASPSAPPAQRTDETTLIPPVPRDGSPAPAPARARRSAGPGSPLPELAALAASERQALDLVWFRARRGQRLLATLRTDGLIELEDGSVHADPGTAATVAADLESPADGWRVWRFGDDGPTLGEAVGARV